MNSALPSITMLQGERERDFVLPPAQERLHLAAAPQPLKDIAIGGLESGVRVGEARSLEWSDVVLEPVNGARYGFIRIAQGKSRNAKRIIPLTERAGRMLSGRRITTRSVWVFENGDASGPLSKSTVSHQHVDCPRLLKLLEAFVVHSFRHTMLTRLGASGADVFLIKKLAGHSSVMVSEKHVHPTPQTVQLALERFEALNGQNRGLPATISAPVDEGPEAP